MKIERKGKKCKVENCNKPAFAKGLCNNHYQQLRRNGFVETKEAKDDNVD